MLQKQALDISFASGLDTKTDSKRVQPGKFLSLENSIFSKQGLLQKRNGYGLLTSLPNLASSYLTTLNNNLTAIGSTINAFNEATNAWVSQGAYLPVSLSVLPLIRNSVNQVQADVAISTFGLVCTVYTETLDNTNYTHKYAIADATTGQNVFPPTVLAADPTLYGTPKVWFMAGMFIIIYTSKTGGNYNLQYISIQTSNPALVTTPATIAAAYGAATTLTWDAVVNAGNLYIAYNTTSGGQAINVALLSSAAAFLGAPPPTGGVLAGQTASQMSVCTDITVTPNVLYVSWITPPGTSASNASFTITSPIPGLTPLTAPAVIQTISGSFPFVNITSVAQNSVCSVFIEFAGTYTYNPPDVPDNVIIRVNVPLPVASFTATFPAGSAILTTTGSLAGISVGTLLTDTSNNAAIPASTTVLSISGTQLTISKFTTQASSPGGDTIVPSAAAQVIRNVGLASKAILYSGQAYFLTAKQSPLQKTYFLVNGSVSTGVNPQILAKVAYQNGAGYLTTGLPNVALSNNILSIPYLFADLVQSVNKGINLPSNTQTASVYSQFGINLGNFVLGSSKNIDSAEIGNDLHLSGGFLWMYDGYQPVEHNFFLYPEGVVATPGTSGSTEYIYQVTYEWADNQGNIYKSAPSVPVTAMTAAAAGTAPAITVNVPILNLTYKTANLSKIVIYRWSAAQQVFYQATSITAPYLNQPAGSFFNDYISFTDNNTDASILGNNIIYTTGGVVEDVNAPASNILSLFDTRLWLVDAEDPNLLWFSKQVIEATPVEMSDLFTVYIPPTSASVGSTGPITALSPLDDKLIVFKDNALYYINGTGPDNTGANNQYSQPIFITSTVGCSNQKSIAFQPQGLMFQSDKGIWLLGRDMSTNYIGAPVEAFTTGALVLSAVTVPGTNQVRFMLDSGVTLMYDYYYQQWGTFTGIPAISSTIQNSLHTFLNATGQVFQESPGTYTDDAEPVQLQFTTGWLNMAGLQGYQRAYFFYLLGQYLSPHKLQVSIAYNYNSSIQQQAIIQPNNFSSAVPSPFGDTPAPFGSPTDVEQWRVFLAQERCQAFQISVQEMYDPTLGVAPGAGLTLSGLNIVYGAKKAWRTISNGDSVGGGNNRG